MLVPVAVALSFPVTNGDLLLVVHPMPDVPQADDGDGDEQGDPEQRMQGLEAGGTVPEGQGALGDGERRIVGRSMETGEEGDKHPPVVLQEGFGHSYVPVICGFPQI